MLLFHGGETPIQFPLMILPRGIGSNWKSRKKHPKDPRFFNKVPIVTFDPANLESIENKHAVSESVFKAVWIIR